MKPALPHSLVAVLALLALPACAGPGPEANSSPTRISKAGLFEVTYTSSVAPVPKRALHSWTLQVHTRDGRPVSDARIRVEGGMPQHGHGLPTAPVVHAGPGDGLYVLEGMKFNMGGYWVVDLAITSPEGNDDVRFELNL